MSATECSLLRCRRHSACAVDVDRCVLAIVNGRHDGREMHDAAGAAKQIGQLGHVEDFRAVNGTNVDVAPGEGCDEMTPDESRRAGYRDTHRTPRIPRLICS